MAGGKGEGRVLASTVHVDGEIYAAGTEVPAAVAALITNPKAWGETPAESTSSEAEKSADSGTGGKSAKKSGGKKDKAPAASSASAADEGGLKPPSKVSGSAIAWRDYAIAAAAAGGLNIDVPEGTKRGEIIAALDAAGISTGA